jgi:hypothetical protein
MKTEITTHRLKPELIFHNNQSQIHRQLNIHN